jgi:hypothetical protein
LKTRRIYAFTDVLEIRSTFISLPVMCVIPQKQKPSFWMCGRTELPD